MLKRFSSVLAAELPPASAQSGRGGIEIADEQGRRTRVAQTDLRAANGVVHVTDGVFLPR